MGGVWFELQIKKPNIFVNISGLLHLLERCGGGLDTSPPFNWSDELSPGELQRLCFARLFFHRPRIAILVIGGFYI